MAVHSKCINLKILNLICASQGSFNFFFDKREGNVKKKCREEGLGGATIH